MYFHIDVGGWSSEGGGSVYGAYMERGRNNLGTTSGQSRDNLGTTLAYEWWKTGCFDSFYLLQDRRVRYKSLVSKIAFFPYIFFN